MATAIALLVVSSFSKCLYISMADQASSSLAEAEKAVGQAFNFVLEAEQSGVNATSLLTSLNEAASLLAQAKVANRTGDANKVTINANRAISISSEVNTAAVNAKEMALVSSRNAFWFTIAFYIIFASAFVLALFLVWRQFRRSYPHSRRLSIKFQDYKLIFTAAGLIGVLLIATPAFSAILHLPSIPSGEQFSELYLLGPGNIAEDYPSNVAVGENYSVYVGVGNHIGSSAYYVLYVKFGNKTDPLPNVVSGTPSLLKPLYECRLFVQDGESWETPLTFSIATSSFSGNQSLISKLTINNVVFNVNKPTNGTMFNYRLLFELWIYNSQSSSIEYNNRSVYLKLNLTAS